MRNNMKNCMTSTAVALALFGTVFLAGQSGQAAGNTPKPPAQSWSFSGMFGTFDRAAAQRGLQVYREVCAACHSLRLVHFRQLSGLGYKEAQIKALAAEVEVTDGPNDEGEMFDRKGTPADKFPSPFANAKAAAASNNGKAPPDLSLMVKARIGGADYLHGLLNGYEAAPAGFKVPEGGAYNKYFPGHVIAMAAPLSDDAIEYQDGTKATVAQMATDVSTFLAWAAEPELEERKSMGIKVLLFLLIFTGLLFAVKRKIWEDVH
jgi:ubiquinol-cytochrome c reductase cytochrome c1 subunit